MKLTIQNLGCDLYIFGREIKQQQMQCGIWVREHDDPGGDMEAIQGLSPSALGSLQLQKNMRSHLR